MISQIITNLSRPNKIVDPFLGKSVLNFDAVVEVAHSRIAVPTKNPVEDLTEISDHVAIQPQILRIRGLISGSPLNFAVSLITSALTAIPDPTARRISLLQASQANLVANSIINRVQVAFDYLDRLWREKQPFTFISKLKSYKNMIITNLDMDINQRTGQALPFTMTMQEILLAEGVEVELAAFRDQIGGASGSPGSVGKVSAEPTSSSVDLEGSLLYQATRNVKIGG